MRTKYEKRLQTVDPRTYDFSDEKVIKEHERYKILENSYPYDELVDTHHLMIANGTYKTDPDAILVTLLVFALGLKDYDSIIINVKSRSVGTPHIHLINWKNDK